MATTRASKIQDINQFQKWKAKNHVDQKKGHTLRGAAVMTRRRKRTNKG